MAKRGVRVEYKYFDKTCSNQMGDGPADSETKSFIRAGNNGALANGTLSTGYFFGIQSLFTGLSCGTYPWNRIGRKVSVKSLQLKGKFSFNSPKNEIDQVPFRIWLFLDKQCNGQPASIGDLFVFNNGEDATPIPAATYNLAVNANQNPANSGRFVLIDTQEFTARPQAGVAANNVQSVTWSYNVFKKWAGLDVEYGGTTGALTEIKSNNLLVIFATSKKNAVTAEAYYDLSIKMRIRFTDA